MSESGQDISYQLATERRQMGFLYVVCGLSIFGLTSYMFIILFVNRSFRDLVYVAPLLIFYLWLLTQVRKRKIAQSAQIVALVGGIGYFLQLYTDLSDISTLFFFNIYPIFVFFLLGKKGGLFYTTLFALALSSVYGLHQLEVIPLLFETSDMRDFAIAFLIASIMVYYYQDLISASQKIIQERDALLAKERDQARAIITSIGEGVFVIDRSGLIRSVNPITESLLGIHSAQAIGQPIHAFFALAKGGQSLSPEDYPAMRAIAKRETVTIVMDDDFYHESEMGQFPVSVVASPIRTSQGESDGAVIVFRDITLDKQSKDAVEQEVQDRTKELEEIRARLLASINSLDHGYIMTNQDPSIVLINNAARHMLHQTSEGMTKLEETQPLSFASIQKIIPGDHDIVQIIKNVIRHQSIEKIKDVSYGKKVLEFIVSPIILGQRVIGAVVLVQDVTEAKIIERSKEEFFSIASHELRTPLTAIHGYSALLKRRFSGVENQHDVHVMVNGIHSESARLISIVNDFLDMSRLEQQKMVYHNESINIGDIVHEVVGIFHAAADEKKIALHVTPIAHGVYCIGDKQRFKQIVINLVGNALKFTDTGEITLEPYLSGGWGGVAVHDTGPGIPLANQSLLFHKFQQAGSSIVTRDVAHGTGLGLYIAKLLAKGMGGDVWLVGSALNKGSTFAVKLPKADN